jgi:hypothetical protein
MAMFNLLTEANFKVKILSSSSLSGDKFKLAHFIELMGRKDEGE